MARTVHKKNSWPTKLILNKTLIHMLLYGSLWFSFFLHNINWRLRLITLTQPVEEGMHTRTQILSSTLKALDVCQPTPVGNVMGKSCIFLTHETHDTEIMKQYRLMYCLLYYFILFYFIYIFFYVFIYLFIYFILFYLFIIFFVFVFCFFTLYCQRKIYIICMQ